MLQIKVSNSLSSIGFNSNTVPILSGIKHPSKINVSTSSSNENYYICNYPIFLATNGANIMTFDYKYKALRFIMHGKELFYYSYDSIKKIYRDTYSNIKNNSLILQPNKGYALSFDDLELDIPEDEVQQDKELCVSKENNIIKTYNDNNYIDSIKPRKSSLTNDLLTKSMSNYSNSSISNISEVEISIKKEDDFIKLNSESLKDHTITIEITGQSPIKFLCSSISQRDSLFARLRNIMNDTLQPARSTQELELVIHQAVAKRPTKSGLFYKNVFLVVVPGRVLEFENEAPKPTSNMSESYSVLSKMLGPTAVPLKLMYKNSCPKEVVTCFNSHPPSFNETTASITLTTFCPEAVVHEYKFDDKRVADYIFKAICLSRDIWDFFELHRNISFVADASANYLASQKAKIELNARRRTLGTPEKKNQPFRMVKTISSSSSDLYNNNNTFDNLNISRIDGPYSTITEVNEDDISPMPVFKTKRLGLTVYADHEPVGPLPDLLTPPINKHFRILFLSLLNNSLESPVNKLIHPNDPLIVTSTKNLLSPPPPPSIYRSSPSNKAIKSPSFSHKLATNVMKNSYFFKSPKASPVMNNYSLNNNLISPAAPDLHRFGFGPSVRDNSFNLSSSRSSSKPNSFSNHVIKFDNSYLNEAEALVIWCNLYLSIKGVRIDYINEMSDGYYFILLVEQIFNINIPVELYERYPKNDAQKMNNINIALKYLEEVASISIDHSGINVIVMKDKRATLNLLWAILRSATIIRLLKFSTSLKSKSANLRKTLLNWVQYICDEVSKNNNVKQLSVNDFRNSFSDGRVFCYLIYYICSGSKIDLHSIEKNSALFNFQLALNAAQEHLHILNFLNVDFFLVKSRNSSEESDNEEQVLNYLCLVASSFDFDTKKDIKYNGSKIDVNANSTVVNVNHTVQIVHTHYFVFDKSGVNVASTTEKIIPPEVSNIIHFPMDTNFGYEILLNPIDKNESPNLKSVLVGKMFSNNFLAPNGTKSSTFHFVEHSKDVHNKNLNKSAIDAQEDEKLYPLSSPTKANILAPPPSQFKKALNFFKSPQFAHSRSFGSANKYISPRNPSQFTSPFSRNSNFNTPSRYDPDGTANFVKNYPTLAKSLSKSSLSSDITLIKSQKESVHPNLPDLKSSGSLNSSFSDVGGKVKDAFPLLFKEKDNSSRSEFTNNTEIDENNEIIVHDQTVDVEALVSFPFPKINRLSSGIAEDRVKKSYVFKIIGTGNEITLDHVKTIWADYIASIQNNDSSMNSVLLEVFIDLASSFNQDHLDYLFTELKYIGLPSFKGNTLIFTNELVNLTAHKFGTMFATISAEIYWNVILNPSLVTSDVYKQAIIFLGEVLSNYLLDDRIDWLEMLAYSIAKSIEVVTSIRLMHLIFETFSGDHEDINCRSNVINNLQLAKQIFDILVAELKRFKDKCSALSPPRKEMLFDGHDYNLNIDIRIQFLRYLARNASLGFKLSDKLSVEEINNIKYSKEKIESILVEYSLSDTNTDLLSYRFNDHDLFSKRDDEPNDFPARVEGGHIVNNNELSRIDLNDPLETSTINTVITETTIEYDIEIDEDEIDPSDPESEKKLIAKALEEKRVSNQGRVKSVNVVNDSLKV